MTTRTTTDDLAFAAQWLLAYEGESGNPVASQDPEDDDEQQASLRRVAAWIEAEIARRAAAAHERALTREVATRHGRPVTDPDVRTAVRNSLRNA